MNPADEKMWATLIHVGSIFFTVLSPLIGFIVFKDRGPFVRAHAATALNFQLTLLLVVLVGSILTLVLIGFVILFAAGIIAILFPIIAAVQANRGQWYQYPLAIRFFR